MKYYRLAVQDYQSAQWKWKTTVLTSLQAVLQLLRSYRMLPQDGIRVFIASSEAELSKMLSQQNDHLESGSVTATQFLQARHISAGEQTQSTSEERVSPQTVQQATGSVARATWETPMATLAAQQGADVATWAGELWEKHRAAQAAQQGALGASPSSQLGTPAASGFMASLGMSVLEMKRLEIELGPGGDHDKPYLFTLPLSQKERLAWIRLQKKVQAGESPS